MLVDWKYAYKRRQWSVDLIINGLSEKTWEEFRSFVVLEVERDQHNSDKFCFQSKGKRFYFGSFLNDDDKLILKNELKRIINQLNTLSPGL